MKPLVVLEPPINKGELSFVKIIIEWKVMYTSWTRRTSGTFLGHFLHEAISLGGLFMLGFGCFHLVCNINGDGLVSVHFHLN